jgi:hypothetical protein
VLHVTATTVGLGLRNGLVSLALWHACVWWWLRRRPVSAAAARDSKAGRLTLLEQLAATVLFAILLTWVGVAAATSDIVGPDAAHYHVPYAINLAAGASPFSLPATPHLYPMAASVVAAWFILPIGDPLIVDLAMALPFALLIASINLLFRCCTGRSGLAWASWLGLALFSTRMFHMTAQGSADLWFAAAFVALAAVVIRAGTQGRWHTLDVLLGAMAAGLLMGSKTTGVPATGLILGAAAIVSIMRRFSGGPRVPLPGTSAGAIVVATLVCVGAGGIWLIRNWIQYGSPLAPAGLSIAGVTIFPGETFQQTTYLSVLGEMQTDSFHLGPRTAFYVQQWFGGWYLPALWPIAIFIIDLIAGVRRRNISIGWWPRLALLVVTVGGGAVLIWLLIGAPWTAIERSRGVTLRYALPIAALLPLVALVGCFPIGFAWYDRARARAIAAAAIVGAAGWLWWHASAPTDPPESAASAPALTVLWFLAAMILTTMLRVRVGRWVAFALLVIAAVGWWAPAIARADRAARASAEARLGAEESAFAAGQVIADTWRQPFLAVRAAEHAQGRTCAQQRFFSLARFDEPIALQPPGFGNLVFYAGRDVDANRREGPIGPCDYVITTPALAQTDKGQALAAALAAGAPLHEQAKTSDVIILAR